MIASFMKRRPFLSTIISPGLDFSESSTTEVSPFFTTGAHHASFIRPVAAPIS